VVALFLAAFVAFLTGLLLASQGMAAPVAFGWSFAVFLGVFVLLGLYMANCMRRHCRHS
jgi:cytosine/uracil/thiamine/allantoin permease